MVEKLNKNYLWFLLDGFGALVSAIFLGVILTMLAHMIGLPIRILYTLAIPACFFATYSFSVYFLRPKNWSPYLKGIAIANLIYCCVTLVILLLYRNELTYLGFAYFILEIIIVVTLATLELRYAKNAN